MKRILGTAGLFALLAAFSFTNNASAQCVTGTGTNILLKWDANGFAFESPSNPTLNVSPAGNVLTVLASPSLLCGPLAGIPLNDPNNEVVVVLSGLVSGGTVTAPFGTSGTKWTTRYTVGQFQVIQHTPVVVRGYTVTSVPSPGVALAQYTVAGTVLLSGPVDSLVTVVTRSSFGAINGSFRGGYRVTGGTQRSSFCNGAIVPGLLNGLWDVVNVPAGYSAHPNGKFDAPDCTTPTHTSTWGQLKSLDR